MTMLCTLIRGQMSYTFFSVGGHMSSYFNCLGGRCPHMPFFIGGHMSGGGEMSYTREKHSFIELTYVVGVHWNCLYEAIPMCTNIICY